MKKKSAIILLIFACVLFGCQKMSLNKAYRNLHMSKYGIEFPPTQVRLDNCIARNLITCIKLYENAKLSKQMLLSIKPTIALNDILSTIQERCVTNEDFETYLCHGAIISLYFFSDKKLDTIILERFKKFPPSLQSMILTESSYAWFSNRPNSNQWVQYLQSLPESVIPDRSRKQVIDYFSGIVGISKYGVTLL